MSGIQRCCRAGCPGLATHSVVVMIPAKGWEIGKHRPLEMPIPVGLCRAHAGTAMPASLLRIGPDLERTVANALTEMLGGEPAAPDFDRAYTQVIPITDPRYAAAVMAAQR